MKRYIVILLTLLNGAIIAQVIDPLDHPDDPFFNFIYRISHEQYLSYDVIVRHKFLFTDDTLISGGHVCLGKKNDSITFIDIRDAATNDRLLFQADSGWYFNDSLREWNFIGKGIDSIRAARFINYVPFGLFTIHYSGGRYNRNWETVKEKDSLKTVSVFLQSNNPEMTSITLLVTINDRDSLVYKSLTDAFLGAYNEHMVEELVFSNYSFGSPSKPVVPLETIQYQQNAMNHPFPGQEDNDDETTPARTSIGEASFFTLDGSPFILPNEGITFLDFWYSGCYPCLKSAPIVEKLYKTFSDQIWFFSVNDVDKDTARIIRFKEKLGVSFPVLLNRDDNLVYRIAGSNAYPLFAIIEAKTGIVRFFYKGYSDELEDILTQAIIENL